jgi:polyketide cyclase/dehydrase/lipid transport protein
MRDVVDVEIRAPKETVAELFSDPTQSTGWMEDLERYEPITGAPGFPGSTYRLVSKSGKMDFVGTVVSRELPNRVNLVLESAAVQVSIDAAFERAPSGATRLVSTEDFRFKSLLGKFTSVFAKPAIHAAHQKQMDAFKRFAEGA